MLNLIVLGVLEKIIALCASVLGTWLAYTSYQKNKIKHQKDEEERKQKQQEEKEKRIKKHLKELIEDEIEQSEKRMTNIVKDIFTKTLRGITDDLLEVKTLMYQLEEKIDSGDQ